MLARPSTVRANVWHLKTAIYQQPWLDIAAYGGLDA